MICVTKTGKAFVFIQNVKPGLQKSLLTVFFRAVEENTVEALLDDLCASFHGNCVDREGSLLQNRSSHSYRRVYGIHLKSRVAGLSYKLVCFLARDGKRSVRGNLNVKLFIIGEDSDLHKSSAVYIR